MEYVQVLRIKKLKGSGIISKAARHNLREFRSRSPSESHIDPHRSSQNFILRGAGRAATIAAKATNLIKQAKLSTPVKSNTVLGLEIIFSLPLSSGLAEQDFFTDAVSWAEGFFEIPILSAIIHNDEAAPHCHVIMLPLIDGRMNGSDLVGYKGRSIAMHADFHAKVGQKYGLKSGMPTEQYSRVAIASAVDSVVNALRRSPNKLVDPAIRDALRDAIAKKMPVSLMELLGLDLPEVKVPKSRSSIEKTNRKSKQQTHVGLAIPVSAQENQTLSRVGLRSNNIEKPMTQRHELRKEVPRKLMQRKQSTYS